MPQAPRIIRVAVPTPLRRHFDYLVPSGQAMPAPGARVWVPFGRQRLVGIVLAAVAESDCPPARLKPMHGALEPEPLLTEGLMALLQWAARYYHHPIGEVLETGLPVLLRQGKPAQAGGISVWSLTDAGRTLDPEVLHRAPVQQRLHAALGQQSEGMSGEALGQVASGWRAAVGHLQAKGWAEVRQQPCLEAATVARLAPPELSPAQHQAVVAITAQTDGFRPWLLFGVTGSGKTEVYLQVIETVIRQGRPVLVLVPEISLTPQLAARFRARFEVPVALLHSGLSDTERLCAWLSARQGSAPIVIGTRSAVFTPLPDLGLIVVDEEHDASFKQHEGFRYHARDVAVMRARNAGIPIVLGSATPSLESFNNAQQGQYGLLTLPDRTAAATLPHVEILDMRNQPAVDGMSPTLFEAMAQRLKRGEQSLLFLNRRGYAPVYMCHACGWLAPCERCDARLIVHRASQRLRCHHCGTDKPIPPVCPACGSENLHPLGEGTERLEGALQQRFPQARVVRIDRDSTRRKGALEALLQQVYDDKVDILVGTQMLSKGHDFPNVTLVGVLNADQGLYSVDFRATEQLFQQVVQVAGRAGRADKRGLVLVQSFHPEAPVFAALRQHDYRAFVQQALDERRQAGFPPFAHLALLRAESPQQQAAMNFVQQARQQAMACPAAGQVEIMEPVPAPMERRAGRYRTQLLVQAEQRAPLHQLLDQWLPHLEASKLGKRVRWSLDVDPMDLY